MFKDAGLSMATLQRHEINHRQVSSLFWINVGLSACLMLLVAGLARPLAWFYHEPRLAGITLTMAATFILSGLTVQHLALLRRQMRFGALVAIDVLTAVARAATTASGWRWAGWGYWALGRDGRGRSCGRCALVWIASPWRRGRSFGGWRGHPAR